MDSNGMTPEDGSRLCAITPYPAECCSVMMIRAKSNRVSISQTHIFLHTSSRTAAGRPSRRGKERRLTRDCRSGASVLASRSSKLEYGHTDTPIRLAAVELAVAQ